MNGRSIATCVLLAALAACGKKDDTSPTYSAPMSAPPREASVPAAAPSPAPTEASTASPPPDMPPPERQTRAPKDAGAAAGTAGVK